MTMKMKRKLMRQKQGLPTTTMDSGLNSFDDEGFFRLNDGKSGGGGGGDGGGAEMETFGAGAGHGGGHGAGGGHGHGGGDDGYGGDGIV